MKRTALLIPLVLLLAITSSVSAQEYFAFRVSGLIGLGGALDDDVSSSFSNTSFQLGFSYESEKDTLVGFRYGQLDFDDGLNDEGFGSARLSYLTVSGEYRLNEGYYQSGLFLGIGAYNLETSGLLGTDDDTGIGATFGVTGEFPVSKRLAVLIEFSAHWADLDAANLFGLGHAGLVYRF